MSELVLQGIVGFLMTVLFWVVTYYVQAYGKRMDRFERWREKFESAHSSSVVEMQSRLARIEEKVDGLSSRLSKST